MVLIDTAGCGMEEAGRRGQRQQAQPGRGSRHHRATRSASSPPACARGTLASSRPTNAQARVCPAQDRPAARGWNLHVPTHPLAVPRYGSVACVAACLLACAGAPAEGAAAGGPVSAGGQFGRRLPGAPRRRRSSSPWCGHAAECVSLRTSYACWRCHTAPAGGAPGAVEWRGGEVGFLADKRRLNVAVTARAAPRRAGVRLRDGVQGPLPGGSSCGTLRRTALT